MVSMVPLLKGDEPGEVKLGLAIIAQAVAEARGSEDRLRREARAWLASPSYVWWAEALDLPEPVVERVAAEAGEAEPLPLQLPLFEMA